MYIVFVKKTRIVHQWHSGRIIIMKKKRLWKVVSLTLLFVLALSGCKKTVGTQEDNAAPPVVKEDEQEVYTFGFSAIDMENPYFITLESAIRQVVEEHEAVMVTKDPASDPKLQAQQIQEMIDMGIDAIFISPVDWIEITPSLQALKDAGIKIINVDTQVKEMEYVDAYIGSDNEEAGYICGQDLIERCPNGGKVLILECPTQNSINDRITGFEKAISKATVGFEVVGRIDTNGEFTKALDAAKLLLEENPDVTVIMCGNDQTAVGATTAVNLLELKDVIIYGVDGSPDIKKELKKTDSQIAATAAQSPINMGKEAAALGLKMQEGENYEKEIYVEVFLIDKDNVDMYGVDGWQ